MLDKNRILKNININADSQCWEWIRSVDADGYARLEVTEDVKKFVHRYAYETFVGIIPDKMTIDHICKNRKCCNPDHLRLATVRENVLSGNTIAARNLAKTHCKHGHEFTKENTYNKRNERVCKICRNINKKSAYLRKINKVFEPKISILEKIQKRLNDNGNGCLLWTGQTLKDGDGYIKINGKINFVHRVIYKEIIGLIPEGFGVHKKCGNKLCCAIEHMHILPNGTVSYKEKVININVGSGYGR